MKLAAIMMVRNEAPIIADSVGHLLHAVQVDSVYVADNGSTDQTSAILHRIAAADGRVKVTNAPGEFRQPEITRSLIQQAVRDGADWLLPNDADEFLWINAAKLRHHCATATGLGGFPLRVCNFAQLQTVRADRPGATATMAFRAVPFGTVVEASHLVSQRALPFLRSNYPHKLLLRGTPDLVLDRGQHTAEGRAGPMHTRPVADLLHAPIRSRDDLRTRVDHGRRLMAVAPEPGIGWHLKRLLGMSQEELDAEWQVNSVSFRRPFVAGFKMDLRLSWLSMRLRPFRQHILREIRELNRHGAPGSNASPA